MLRCVHAEEVRLLRETITKEKEEEMSRKLQLLKYEHRQEMQDAKAKHEESMKVQS